MSVGATGERTSARRSRQEMPVRISAKTDYALRATAELAAANGDGLVKADQIAQAQGIPLKFLLNILNELKQDEIVRSQAKSALRSPLAPNDHPGGRDTGGGGPPLDDPG